MVLSMSSMMLMKKTPMLLLITMVWMSVLTSMMMVSINMGHWVSLLLVMVYVSGVMVLFMYATSLSPYEKNTSKKMTASAIIVTLMVMQTQVNSMGVSMSTNALHNSYNSNFSMMFILIVMLTMMATTMPKVSMNMNKGLKSSK